MRIEKKLFLCSLIVVYWLLLPSWYCSHRSGHSQQPLPPRVMIPTAGFTFAEERQGCPKAPEGHFDWKFGHPGSSYDERVEVSREKAVRFLWEKTIVIEITPICIENGDPIFTGSQHLLVKRGNTTLHDKDHQYIGPLFTKKDFPFKGCRSLLIISPPAGSSMPAYSFILTRYPNSTMTFYLIDRIGNEEDKEFITDYNGDGYQELKLLWMFWSDWTGRSEYPRLLVFDKSVRGWRLDKPDEIRDLYKRELERAKARILDVDILKGESEMALNKHLVNFEAQRFLRELFQIAHCNFMLGRPMEEIKKELLKRYRVPRKYREGIVEVIQMVEKEYKRTKQEEHQTVQKLAAINLF